MPWEALHKKIKIRSSIFGWPNQQTKKESLRWNLTNKIDIEEIFKIHSLPLKEPLFLDVCYYIFEKDKSSKSHNMESLIEILVDVFSKEFGSGKEPHAGLGLIKDKSLIYKIKCEKKMVKSEDEEGFDFLISGFV